MQDLSLQEIWSHGSSCSVVSPITLSQTTFSLQPLNLPQHTCVREFEAQRSSIGPRPSLLSICVLAPICALASSVANADYEGFLIEWENK